MAQKRNIPQSAADNFPTLRLDTPDFHPDDVWLEQLAKLLILANGREDKQRERSQRKPKTAHRPNPIEEFREPGMMQRDRQFRTGLNS